MSQIDIKKLEELIPNELGETIEKFFYPVTHAKAVYVREGWTLWDELQEIKDSLFPVSLSVSASKTVFNAADSVEKKGTLTVRILKNEEEIDRDEVKNLTSSVSSIGNVSLKLGNQSWDENKAKVTIPFEFADSGTDGYSSHTITIKAELTSGKVLTGSVIVKEIATSYIGFIKAENPSSSIFNNPNNVRKIESTSLAGTYVFEQIPEDYCFWMITPAYPIYEDPVGMTNQFPITLTKFEDTYEIDGVTYEFFRNSTGKLESATWTIDISDKK